MTSFNHARFLFALIGALYCCACSGAPPESGDGKPAPDTYTASAQVSAKCAASHEQLIDLGVLDQGLDFSYGYALNAQGTVVGYSDLSSCLGITSHGFRWKAETGMVDLGVLTGNQSGASDVNDREEVVGTATTADASFRAVLWDAQNRIHDLGTLGGKESGANSINNRGQVVGYSTDAAGFAQSFIWDATTGMVSLELPEHSSANDINDSGVVVGGLSRCDGTTVPFKWTKEDGAIELDLLGGSQGEAYAVNNRGEIVGSVLSGAEFIGVEWSASGVASRLPNVPKGVGSAPRSINDAGAIAGEDPALGHFIAVRWDPMLRVSAIPLTPEFSVATHINNCGDITGTSWEPSTHAFIWRPERAAQ